MQRSAWRRGLGNLLLAGVSLVVALVVVELGLRLYFYGSLARPDYSMSFHEPHPTRGWTLLPNATGRQQELDFNVEVSINSKGVRGPEIDYARTPGVYRILIVSDSAMFGSGLVYEDTVPARLVRLLEPTEVEIVNLSVAAYSNVQEYVLFMEEGLRYRPDLVLFGFAPGNDLQTNYEPLQRLFQKSQRRPFARLDSQGRLVVDYRYAEQAVRRAAESTGPGSVARFFKDLVLVRLTKAAVQKFEGDKRVDPNIFLGPPYMKDFVETDVSGMSRSDYERLWSEAWQVTEAVIREIQAESERMGARFALFVATSKLQGDPEMQARVAEAYPEVALDVGRIDREMAALADRIGAPFLPLLPAMQAAVAEAEVPLFFGFADEHWTAAGSAIIAQALADGLRAEGLVPAD